jgi:histidinol-phosphatase (PHP family)
MKPLAIDTTIDGHMHTALCGHARGTMEEYVQAGLRKGLKKIIFLEHLETGIGYFETTWLNDYDFDYYFEEGERLQKKYRGLIDIGLGVEVGYNPDMVAVIRSKLESRRWDRIGISYHFLKTDAGHLNMVSSNRINVDALNEIGLDQVITAYYRHLTNAVRQLPGDVLCHFDAVLRHHPHGRRAAGYDVLIDRLLDAVKEKAMAIEVNTSGYRIRDEPYPSLQLLGKVADRGISLVAGSDAHRPEDVGSCFDRLAALTLRG